MWHFSKEIPLVIGCIVLVAFLESLWAWFNASTTSMDLSIVHECHC